MVASAKPETKDTPIVAEPSLSQAQQETTQSPSPISSNSNKEKFKAAIASLDAERTTLVKNTIENLKPGRPFDHAVIREINKIETRKNRLLVSRFAAMLKKNEPGIMPIVHQILDM